MRRVAIAVAVLMVAFSLAPAVGAQCYPNCRDTADGVLETLPSTSDDGTTPDFDLGGTDTGVPALP